MASPVHHCYLVICRVEHGEVPAFRMMIPVARFRWEQELGQGAGRCG